MKKLSKNLIITVLSVFLVAGTAMAVPTDLPSNTAGYNWVNNTYWTCTDLTTGGDGSSFFLITLENASYESDFGLFTVNDVTNPTTIVTKFEVFDKDKDPGNAETLYFRQVGSNWSVSLDDVTYTAFDNVFGFYYGIYTNPTTDTNPAYSYFSDSFFNTEDQNDEHVAIEWDGKSNAKIYLEDMRTSTADWDWRDMTIHANDVSPIPEPTTMLLLGSGLIGLARFGRKKKLFRKG